MGWKKYILSLVLFIITLIGNNKIILADSIMFSNDEIIERQTVNFQSLTVNEGLSNNYITNILQDSRGFIWIGTEVGLNRYDGSSIEYYNYEYGNENSLNSTYITALAEDAYGNIWVGTDGGLSIINANTNEITRLGNNEYDSSYSLSNCHVTTIFKDNNDNMWVGTINGLNLYDEKSGKFINYYAEKGNKKTINGNYITDIESYIDNSILVTTENGAAYIDIDSLEIDQRRYNYKNDKYIYSADFDSNYKFWYSTKQGIHYFDKNQIQGIYFDVDIGERINTDIRYILCDSKDNVWFASSNGLIKYDQKEKNIELFKSNKSISNGLLSNYITYIYEDRNGVIWIGTDNGVNILNTLQPFDTKINDIFDKIGIPESSVTSILEDSDGDIWIGTIYSGIINFNLKTKEIKRYIYDKTLDNSLSSNTINDIFEVDKGIFLVATNEYTDVIYKKDGIVKNIKEDAIGQESNKNYLRFYNDGISTWVGSNDGFYVHLNGENIAQSYKNIFNEKNIANHSIVDVFQDEKDKNILWLAGGRYTGLIKFHKEEGIIKNYTSNKFNDFTYDDINCIQGDGNGNLWLGTKSGLNKFNIESEKFTSYSEKDGLTDECINSILIDDYGNLWLGTSSGLSKFNIEKQKFINYSEIDGVQGNIFNREAAYKMKNGQMLFGTNKGVVSFKPEDLKEEIYNEERVVLGNILVNKKTIEYNLHQDIILNHNESNIEFSFFLPDYARVGGVSYMYKLEGVDSDWKYVDGSNKASYTLLSPGNYNFKVMAIKSNGDITEESSVSFIIKNPIWKTKAAYLLYFMIISFIFIYRRNRVKILKSLVDKKTKELNEQMVENKKLYEKNIKNEKFKNDYFVNLSHELRTPINIILSTVQLVKALGEEENISWKKAVKYINIISKSSNNLLKIISDIIDTSKIESGAYKINKEEDIDIVYLVEETALGMSSLINEKGIELIIDPEIEEKTICCDPNEIERCIINLIGNSVKFTEAGGEIRVLIKEDTDSVSISVEDTGLGISLEDQEFIFNRFEQGENMNSTNVSSSGIGLALVKNIVELHNGKVTLESELNKGSKFTITLPG